MSVKEELLELGTRVEFNLPQVRSESGVRDYLVMPFVAALGYDHFDPLEVQREYHADELGIRQKERVDLAVLRLGEEKPRILVEIKKHSASLDNEDFRNQLFNYYVSSSARLGILTNGIEYRFFTDGHIENVMSATPFLTVEVTKLTEEQARILALFSRDDYRPEEAFKQAEALAQQKENKRKEQATSMKNLEQGPVIDDPEMPPSDGDGWVSLDNYNPTSGAPAPLAIRFRGGSPHEVGTWREMRISLCEWLIRREVLTLDSVLQNAVRTPSGAVKPLAWIGREDAQSNGKPFQSAHPLTNGVWISAHLGRKSTPRHCRELVELLGEKPSEVSVKPG